MKTSNCCDAFVNPDLMICSDCKKHCGFGEEETPEWRRKQGEQLDDLCLARVSGVEEEWEKEFDKEFNVSYNYDDIQVDKMNPEQRLLWSIFRRREKDKNPKDALKQFIKEALAKERERIVREIKEYVKDTVGPGGDIYYPEFIEFINKLNK